MRNDRANHARPLNDGNVSGAETEKARESAKASHRRPRPGMDGMTFLRGRSS